MRKFVVTAGILGAIAVLSGIVGHILKRLDAKQVVTEDELGWTGDDQPEDFDEEEAHGPAAS